MSLNMSPHRKSAPLARQLRLDGTSRFDRESQINVPSLLQADARALQGEPVRNAINVPIRAETFGRCGAYMPLSEQLGKFCIQLVEGQIQALASRIPARLVSATFTVTVPCSKAS